MTDPTPYTDDDVKQMQDDGAAITGTATRVPISAQLARRLLNAGYRKVVPDTPAEEDVKALAQDLAHTSNVGSDFEDDARRLLAKGWHKLPPEPDTPPEPQERYYVGDGQSDNKVYERGRALYAETYLAMDADRIARLLNLDAKYEDQGGVAKALEQSEVRSRMRSAAITRLEAERDEARAEVERLTSHVEHWKNEAEYTQERVDKLLAEVERLTALVREVAGAGVASTNRKYVEVQIDVDTWADLSAEISEPAAVPQDDGPTEPLVGGIAACEVCGAGGCDDVHEAPTEPLFTGGPMTTPAHYRRKPKVIDVLVWTGDNLDDVAEFLSGYVSEFSVLTGKGPSFRMTLDGSYGARLWVTKSQAWCDVNLGDGIAQETDRSGFYPIAADRLAEDFDPADEQPTTNQPVTAEMVYGAVEAAGVRDGLDRGDGPAYIRPCDWTSGETLAVADALNRLLADRAVAWAPPEAER